MECIFCQIVKGAVPVKKVFESATLLAFPDNSPSADVHLLIIPKKHIDTIGDLGQEHANLLAEVYKVANKLVLENNLKDSPYRIVVNGGKAQHVPHLHFHLLGGNLKKLV